MTSTHQLANKRRQTLRKFNHTQLALVLCFCNFRLQSCVIKQTTVWCMRSERGLSTILHCLQWYKLVLRTPYSFLQCSI